MYEDDFVAIYDEFYRQYKDFAAETDLIRSLVDAHRPGARSLLDVGCGTGEHLAQLRSTFEVVGVDYSEAMVREARRKLPGVAVHRADMRAFRAGRTFDVVCSVYSAVGYLESRDALVDALRTMTAHLAPGGLLLVEPWIFRENWNGGDLVARTLPLDGRLLSRMGRWRTEGDHTVLEMHYLVGDGRGVSHFVDHQRLVLLSEREYRSAFAEAGLEVDLVTPGFTGRGLFVATRAGA